MVHLLEEYIAKFGKETTDLIEVFGFLDKGLEVNVNELENPSAKALLLKMLETLDIKAILPGVFKLENGIGKHNLKLQRLMRWVYKGRLTRIRTYLEQNYPIKRLNVDTDLANESQDLEIKDEEKEVKLEPVSTKKQSGKMIIIFVKEYITDVI